MAARYWVGGTDTWDGTAGTKWALTSGGAGGQAVPTSSDDVFFDGASGANTVTVSGSRVCKSLTCTGFTGTLAGTSTPVVTVSGDVTLASTLTFASTGPAFTVDATSTFTSGGKSINNLTVNASGGTVTLGDALAQQASTNIVTVTAGTFTTSASNYSLSAGYVSSTGASTRAINFNGSTVTLNFASNSINFSGTGLTFTAGTSQINVGSSSAAATFNGNGETFYNVSFTSASNTPAINGANTFNNLTFTAPTSGLQAVVLSASQTVNATLTCSGATAVRRLFLCSDILGTTRTITVATFAPTDCDFRDITVSGGASPISGTRLGDCGGNSGITFPAPKTVYWNPVSSTNFNSTGWATASGSTTLSINNFPLAQDTAVIDENSRGACTGSGTGYNLGTIDMSARTSAYTFNLSAISSDSPNIYKDFLFGTGLTVSGSSSATITFAGRATQTITPNGITFPENVTIASYGSTVQLAGTLTVTNALTLTSGTFDAKTYNVTAASVSITGSTTRTLTMGSGTWTLSGTGTVWTAATTTNLTFNKNTANITLSDTSTTARTFAGGGLTYNKLTIGGATGTSTLTISGSNTFSELASTKTVAHTISFTAGTTTTVADWTITGTVGNVVTIGSVTAASHTLTKTGGGTISVDYMSISRSTATPGGTWYAGLNSTNGGNNSGWTFNIPGATVGNFFALF